MNEALRDEQIRTLCAIYACQRCEGSGDEPTIGRTPDGEAGDCGNCSGSGLETFFFPDSYDFQPWPPWTTVGRDAWQRYEGE